MEQIEIFELREADRNSLAAINLLLKQLTDSDVELTEEGLQQITASDSSHLFLISCGGKIAGMLTLGVYNTPTGLKAWIEDVVVDLHFRGRNLGSRLVEHAIGFARSLGDGTLMLTSNPARVAANRLYQTVGFEPKQTNVYRMIFRRQ